MAVELMDPRTERQAIEVVKQAIGHSNEEPGLSPSRAVIKAAQGHDFTPDMLCRLVEAYNGSAHLHHLETADEDKRADVIPLADPVEVIEAFYPEKPKEREKAAADRSNAGHDDPIFENFMAVPDLEKAAREEPIRLSPKPRTYMVDPGSIYQHIRWNKEAACRQAEELKTEAQSNVDKIAGAADLLVEYFRTLGHTPFADVEKRAMANFEDIGLFMDHVFKAASLEKLGEKRSQCSDEDIAFVDESQPPYLYIKQAAESAQAFAQAAIRSADIMDGAEHRYNGHMKDLEAYKEAQGAASVFGGAAKGMGAMLQPGEPTPPMPMPVLTDPEHEARLAAITQRAVLNDLMQNDPVIAAVDPQTVIQAFNRLSEIAPSLAREPNLLRSTLRRFVQQEDIDPFELKQLVDLDISLRQREEPGKMERYALG